LEATRLHLEELQKELDERARQRPQVSTQHHRQLFPPADNLEVFRTPIQNVAAAAKIADSIEPSNSEAGRGLEQIRALLGAARQQNSAVSQSRNRIHSKSPRADTVQSAHSPGSPLRRRGGGYHNDQYQDQGRDQFAPHNYRDDRRRVPSPPRGGHTCPGTMMIGARTTMSRPLGSMRGQSLFRIESTGADTTEMVMIEIFRVEAGQSFQAQSVLAEPFNLLKFPPTTGWQLG
jgi:hypothetical protein